MPMIEKMSDEVINKYRENLFNMYDRRYMALKRIQLISVGTTAFMDLMQDKEMNTEQVLKRVCVRPIEQDHVFICRLRYLIGTIAHFPFS
jgi:hypothetical protein